MKRQQDARIVELETLAQEEGIALPYPVEYILFLEDHGRFVDLMTGQVIYAKMVATPTASAQAVSHLLAAAQGDISI